MGELLDTLFNIEQRSCLISHLTLDSWWIELKPYVNDAPSAIGSTNHCLTTSIHPDNQQDGRV